MRHERDFLLGRLRGVPGWPGSGKDTEFTEHHVRRCVEDIRWGYEQVVREAERPPPRDLLSRWRQQRELHEIVRSMRRNLDLLDRTVLGLEVQHALEKRQTDRSVPDE